jgi:hypothetical protein
MIAFLKTILIILLVYYGLKFLIKLIAPYLLQYITKKAGQKFEEAFGANPTSATPSQEEGSVTVDKMPFSKGKSKNTAGEYVDYEEVD